MRPVDVVVGFEFAQSLLKVAGVPDQDLVQQLATAGQHPAFHDRVHARHSDAGQDDPDAGVVQNGVEARRTLPIAVRIRYLSAVPASSTSMTRFLAAWVTQSAVGWAVAPRTRIRRVVCSMTARMY
jgi:hypothetical protein